MSSLENELKLLQEKEWTEDEKKMVDSFIENLKHDKVRKMLLKSFSIKSKYSALTKTIIDFELNFKKNFI